MSRTKLRRRFKPRFDGLESRSLLSSSAQFVGFSAVDTTGPTAAIGPGGYTNLDLEVVLPLNPNNQPTSLDYLNITGPTGFQWTYGTQSGGVSNAQAAANVTVAPGVINTQSATETYQISISPVVYYVNPKTGTGSNITIPNNSQLSLTDQYTLAGTTTIDSWQSDPALVVTATGLNQNLADLTPPIPALGFVTYPGTAEPQSASNGYGHISITNLPAGTTIKNASAELSDVAGLYWNTDSLNSDSYGRGELVMTISQSTNASNNTVTADVAFPPLRDEAGSTMTFRFRLNNDPTNTVYVTDVAFPSTLHTDPNLRDGGPVNLNSTPVMVSPTASSTPNMVTYTYDGSSYGPTDIQTLLDMEYQNLEFTDGSTGGIYTINEPLNIHSRMILKAADANVTFMFTMPSVTQGVINFYSSHITLDGFKVRFSNSNVAFTAASNSDGIPAIISGQAALHASDYGEQIGLAFVDINVENLDIQAPYFPQARDPRTDTSSDPDPTGVGNAQGAIHAIYTIDMGGNDSGTITGNTIYGGPIHVYNGPWTIDSNQVLGAVQGSLSNEAFQVNSGHDITLNDNTVTDLNPTQNGIIDRFFVANGSGYNFNLTSNHVGVDGAASGNIGMPAVDPGTSASGNPRNNPEMILFEDYRKAFEGSVLAVGVSSSSSTGNDRRLVAIPSAELSLFTGGEGTSGLTLTVLDGPDAGSSTPVLQTFNSDASVTPAVTYFLLASSLPQGTFDIDISPAYANPTISKNIINTSGTISTGLVLASTIINAQIFMNNFEGDQSSETTGYDLYQSQAIRVELQGAHYPINNDDQSFCVVDAAISQNTIVDAIGGIRIKMDAQTVQTTYGRTYGFVTLTNNTFRYSYSNPNIIDINVHTVVNNDHNLHTYSLKNDSYSKPIGNSVVYDPTAAYFIDPRTFAITASGNTVQWGSGVTPPQTDVTANAAEINSVLYEADASVSPALLPTASSGSSTPPTVTSLGQDGHDLIGNGSGSTGFDGYQDIHFVLSGLPSSETIQWIDVLGGAGGEWQYDGPGNTDKAVLVLQSGSATTADLYVSPFQDETGDQFHVYIYYTDRTSVDVYTTPVYATYHLVDPTATSLGQDGHDYVGNGSNSGSPDGYQDIDIALAGLPSSKTVSWIDVQGYGGGEWQYDGPGNTDKAYLVRASGSTTADLFVSPYENETGRTYAVTVYYSDGTSVSATTNGVYATYHLVDPTATSLGQDGHDYVGNGSNSGSPDGYQDIDIALAGLPSSKTVSWIDVQGYGGGEWQYDGPGNTDKAYLVRASGSTTADLFVSPYENETGRTYAVTVYYSDGTSVSATTNGVYATYHLPDNTPALGDPGFEQAQVGNYQYNPSGSAWTFSSNSGLAADDSGFTAGNGPAPQGSQVAFLQSYGTIMQSVAGWGAGSYTLSFYTAQRGNQASSAEDFEVLVDGNVVGTFKPVGPVYQFVTTASFTVTAGSHAIEFLGLDSVGGDNTALIDAVTVAVSTATVPTIGDYSFEQAQVGNYQYNPSGSAWTFSSNSGLAADDSGFTAGNGPAPQGSQVAFLQSYGTIMQSVAGWAAGSYKLSFDTAQRGNQAASAEDFEVLIDGVVVSTFKPVGPMYQYVTTASFAVAAGSHTIEFVGVDSVGGDNTALIDDVTVATA